MQVIKIIVLLGLIWCCSCKNESTVISALEHVEHTQAILKVQGFDYQMNNKDSISGPYVQKDILSIPAELAGQNKWIMFEGPVLENDQVAYRFYADRRHRFDIYGKKVSTLVMDTVSWNYHDIMDWGSDILKVGNSLGIGSPGILYKDSIYTLSNWKTKTIERVSEDGHQGIRTIFKEVTIGEITLDIIQLWTLPPHTKWSTIELSVIDGKLPSDMAFVTGIVKHIDTYNWISKNNLNILSTWGKQSFHKQNLGMAISTQNNVTYVENELSHVILFDKGQSEIEYQFMADWSEGINGSPDSLSFLNNLSME